MGASRSRSNPTTPRRRRWQMARGGQDHGDARAGGPDRSDDRDTDDQPQGQGTRAMSDGMTRRGALTRGFGGIALVCSFKADPRKASGGKKTSAFVRSASSTPFDPFQRDVPIPPVATPTSATEAARAVHDHDEAGNGRHPDRARHAGAGLQRPLPGADDQGHARARGADPPDQPERARPQRAPARRRDRAAVRRAPARLHPDRDGAALQVPERRPLGDALVPRPRARRDAPDAVRGAGGLLPAR